MKKSINALIIVIIMVLSGCSEAVSFNGNVKNVEQFTCKSYNAEDYDISSVSGAGIMLLNSSLEKYEERALRGFLFKCSGEAAIIRGVKTGDSESYYNNAGVIELEDGEKRTAITAFTLTKIKILEIFEGETIRLDDNALRAGDVITVYELPFLRKGDDGKDVLVIPYESYRFPILKDTEYILYLSRIRDGYVHHEKYPNAVTLNDCWLSGEDMFVLDDETKTITSSDDVKRINGNADRNYYLNEYLYPEVISKYGGNQED